MVDGRFNAQHGRMVKITQKVLGLRATKNVTEIDKPTKAGKMDTNERGQMLIKNELQSLRRRGHLHGMREDGKSKGEKEGPPERNLKDCGRNLQLKVSWPGENCEILPRRGRWKMEEVYPKKMAINCGKIELCMKRTFCAVGCSEEIMESGNLFHAGPTP